MTTRYAIVVIATGVVDNVVMLDPATQANPQLAWPVPAGHQEIASDTANIGDTWNGSSFVAANPPPAPTLAQQAAALLFGGCHVTSTGTPALSATYPCDPTAQQQINAEITSILLNGTFADGETTIGWLDATGASHTFSIAEFKALATEIAAFVSGCIKVINGQSTTLPSASVTIP
jgi:hypothetical protein